MSQNLLGPGHSVRMLWGRLAGAGRRHPGRARRRSAYGLLAVVVLLAGFWGVRLLRLRAEIGRYRTYWAHVAARPAPPRALRYVALGDSAAQGIGASDPEHGYVGLVADRLHLATGRPVLVLNISRTGARVDDVLRDQLPRLAALHPDFVTVDVGGNDVRRYRAADWSAGAAALCAGLPPGRSVVAGVPWFMHGHWERDARQARAVLAGDCAADGVAVAPLAHAFQSHGWLGMFTLYAADWFHPNNHGHRLWADAIWSTASATPGLLQRAAGGAG